MGTTDIISYSHNTITKMTWWWCLHHGEYCKTIGECTRQLFLLNSLPFGHREIGTQKSGGKDRANWFCSVLLIWLIWFLILFNSLYYFLVASFFNLVTYTFNNPISNVVLQVLSFSFVSIVCTECLMCHMVL